MINARVRVKFAGGREMVGVLKGYDQLLNVVLDETVEYLRDAADATRVTETTRGLGLIVCRGPNITCVRRGRALSCARAGLRPLRRGRGRAATPLLRRPRSQCALPRRRHGSDCKPVRSAAGMRGVIVLLRCRRGGASARRFGTAARLI